MALLHPSSATTRLCSLGQAVAAGLALLYALPLCAAHGSQLDGSQLLAHLSGPDASGWSSPTLLVAQLLRVLVPLGPLSFRVALASALGLAALAAVLYRSTYLLLRTQGVAHDALCVPIALGMSLFAAAAPSTFSHAIDPQLAPLQVALTLLVLLQLTRLQAAFPTHDLRTLYRAGLCFGLLASSAPLCALALLPAVLPTLTRVQRAKGSGPLVRGALMAASAFCAVHLPGLLTRDLSLLRESGSRAADLHNVGALLSEFGSQVGGFGVLALLGMIALWQTPGVRRIGILWSSACASQLLVHGMLTTTDGAAASLAVSVALAACAVLATGLIGALLSPDALPKASYSRAQLTAAMALSLVGFVRLHATAERAPQATPLLDALSGRGRHLLPARALVLGKSIAATQAWLATEGEDRARPDVLFLPLGAFDHPQASQALPAHAQQLRPLLREYLLTGELDQSELESLAAQRPVFLELDPRLPPRLYEALRPQHLLYEVLGASVSKQEERLSARRFLGEVSRVRQSAPHLAEHAAPSRLLAHQLLATALYFTALGDRTSAVSALDAAHALAPSEPLRRELSDLLQAAPDKGPIDVAQLVARQQARQR